MDRPTFSTPLGPVSGSYRTIGNTQVSVFRAIPIAVTEPFGSPVSPAPWEETLDCADTRDRRAQRLPTTLSVYAPAHADPASLPVIGWIHGGRYEEGHGDDGWYNGSALAAQGCVVVALNYRKRLEGFLPLNEDAPGSFRGVDDLLHALRWVQKATPAVGGDPDNVTLIGQSAGGGLVMSLLTDRRADRLFHRAVVLSPGLPRILPRIGWRARRTVIRRRLEIPLTREALSAVPEPQRDAAYQRLSKLYFSDCAVGPGPIDLTELREVPLLVSTMQDELIRFPGVAKADQRMQQQRLRIMKTRLAMMSLGVPRRNLTRWRRYIGPDQPMARTVNATLIRRWAAGLLEAAPGGRVWSCEFRGGDWHGERIDAQHCGELPLLFNTLTVDEQQTLAVCGPDAEERLSGIGERFRSAVLAFAHGHTPGWTPYSEHRTTRIFDLLGGPDQEVRDPLQEIRTLLPVSRKG